MQAWLTERMAARVVTRNNPDAVVALQVGDRSGVLCLEIDEGTQHAPVIRARLRAYAVSLAGRAGWHVVFVVPTRARMDWLRRVHQRDVRSALAGRGWVVRRDSFVRQGLDAQAYPLAAGTPRPLRSILTDHRSRRTLTPVGSPAGSSSSERALASRWTRPSSDWAPRSADLTAAMIPMLSSPDRAGPGELLR